MDGPKLLPAKEAVEPGKSRGDGLQPPGQHRLKAFGSNSQGQGDESEDFEIELVASAANNGTDQKSFAACRR